MTRIISFFIALCILAIAGMAYMYIYDSDNPFTRMETNKPVQQRVVGSIPYWDQQAAVASFKKNIDLIDSISLYWYVLRQDGSITPYPYANIDSSLISYAHDNGIKATALIANFALEEEGDDWNADHVQNVIHNVDARRNHIADIVTLLATHKFDGVNIDYEALRDDQREDFTQFIAELSEELHARGKTLSVALHPKTREGDPKSAPGSQAQDWKKLAQYADELHLMTYEQHWETSEPGPAASVEWMSPIIRYAQKLIPTSKLFVGIPLYGYDWSDGKEKAQGLTFKDVERLISMHNPSVQWDAASGTKYFYYEKDGTEHEVWFEDNKSLQVKLNALEKLGVANVFFWRLGNEDTTMWTSMKLFLQDESTDPLQSAKTTPEEVSR